MKAVVAIDSFKGSLSTFEAGEAAAKALELSGFSKEDITVLPMSDGGEGFCKVVGSYLSARTITQQIRGPFGAGITAEYLLAGETAYIESASACGYTLVSRDRLDPLAASSSGLGALIRDAVRRGARRIVVGMGGTCTVDAGIGMLQALGARFTLADGSILPEGEPALMKEILSMDTSAIDLNGASIEAWSDTEVPMADAVRVFGRQKGLGEEMLGPASDWMGRAAALFGDNGVAGGGAAGGIGAALADVLGARIRSGADGVIDLSGLSKINGTDLLITGEGRLDSQTLTGKLPARVAAAGRKSGSRHILCLAGSVELEGTGCFDSVLQTTPAGTPLSEAMANAAANLTAALSRRLLSNIDIHAQI